MDVVVEGSDIILLSKSSSTSLRGRPRRCREEAALLEAFDVVVTVDEECADAVLVAVVGAAVMALWERECWVRKSWRRTSGREDEETWWCVREVMAE